MIRFKQFIKLLSDEIIQSIKLNYPFYLRLFKFLFCVSMISIGMTSLMYLYFFGFSGEYSVFAHFFIRISIFFAWMPSFDDWPEYKKNSSKKTSEILKDGDK